MKRVFLLLLVSILILTGCSVIEQSSEATLPAVPDANPEVLATEEVTYADTELLSVSVPAGSESYCLEDGTELLTVTSQHMQLIHPDEEIADKVIIDFLNRVDAAQADVENILNAAQNDYDPNSGWFPYFCQTVYSPTRIDPGVLSLFGTQNNYSGGMHGSLSCIAANYDLTTGDVLTLGSIMHMDAEKKDFIRLIIKKLSDVADDLYLFDDYEEGVYSRLDVDENLYEDFFFTSTGLAFFFSPYEIAPYASGIITVEIPYSELTGLIYDGYFPAERETISGEMHTGSFMQTDMEQFSNMAEVTLTAGEEIMVAYPEGKVEDIRITVPGDGMGMPDYTAFAAYEMSEQDAVVISLRQEEIDGILISYTTTGKSDSIPLSK